MQREIVAITPALNCSNGAFFTGSCATMRTLVLPDGIYLVVGLVQLHCLITAFLAGGFENWRSLKRGYNHNLIPKFSNGKSVLQ